MKIAQPRENLELLKVTFVCGASANKVFRKCGNFKVPIRKGKQPGLDFNNI